MRVDGRKPDELREVKIIPGVNTYAEGSVSVEFGGTRLLITATVEQEQPRWMQVEAEGGWITAEYGMLPRATHTRCRREAAAGKQSGRTLEIQRLIGRSLRAAVDLKQLGPHTIRLDCDVIAADGGTRTAAITGGWVALAQAIFWMKRGGLVNEHVELRPLAAVSVGVLNNVALLDLCYREDSVADFDCNVVLAAERKIVEVQGTAEAGPVDRESFDSMLNLAAVGIDKLMELQRIAADPFLLF